MATEKDRNKTTTTEHMPCRMEDREVVAMEREMELEMEREREMLRERAMELRAKKREALMAKERELDERERAIDQGPPMENEKAKIVRMRSAIANELEMKDAGEDHMPCRRHLRQGPILMEDPIKAAALHMIRAALKEDPTSCYICIARAAALDRIKAVGGDNVKAAEDSESCARADIYINKRVAPSTFGKMAEEDSKARPVGVVKTTMKVLGSYFGWLLTHAPLTPLDKLPEDYFEDEDEDEDSTDLRERMLALAFATLSRIDEMDNILGQFLEKGHAMVDLQVDYGY